MFSVSTLGRLSCEEKKEGEEGEEGEEGREGKEGRKGGKGWEGEERGKGGGRGEGEEGEEWSQLDLLWTIQKDFDQCGLSWPPSAFLGLLLSPTLVVIKS